MRFPYRTKKFVDVLWVRIYNQLVNFFLPNFPARMGRQWKLKFCGLRTFPLKSFMMMIFSPPAMSCFSIVYFVFRCSWRRRNDNHVHQILPQNEAICFGQSLPYVNFHSTFRRLHKILLFEDACENTLISLTSSQTSLTALNLYHNGPARDLFYESRKSIDQN